ncbi:histidine kinase [Ideonella sp. DXS22W]|uniref:Histidine kinase n=1 Tax=Pseudaquabacterium inlustre TaxID=2984192 RepID=A0ABU9CF37_9BURK
MTDPLASDPPPPEPAASPATAAAVAPALNLPRTLLRRWLLLVAVLVLLLAGWEGWRLRRDALDTLPATARLATRLVLHTLSRSTNPFDREPLPAVSLDGLAELEQRVPLCVQVIDLQRRAQPQRCGAASPPSPLGQRLGALLQPHDLARARLEMSLLLPDGIRVGVLEVGVYWASVGEAWLQRIVTWLGLGAVLAALVAAVVLPVERALKPTRRILAALAQLEAGDLAVRLPVPRLRELRDIAERFNRLAERWQSVLAEQRRLAARLLDTREEERRNLARELHDEMGQSLTALRAEAAVVGMLAGRAQANGLKDGAARIAELGAQLLDGLQGVLQALRPTALDRFGLAAALQGLVAQPRRRTDGLPLRCTLALPEAAAAADPLAAVPAAMAVHVYRIVQEGLTNAARHGQAQRAQVSLQVRPAGPPDGLPVLLIEVVDDGRGPGPAGPTPGHGLLGMHERVQALAGALALDLPAAGGMRLAVRLPLPATAPPRPTPDERSNA